MSNTNLSRMRTATAEQRKIVDELCHLRDYELKLRDSPFHATYLVDVCSLSTWGRIQDDKYTGDTAGVIAELAKALTALREKLRFAAAKQEHAAAQTFFEMPIHTAVFKAIEKALQRADENRIVFYTAPFGYSKTAMIAQLANKFGALRPTHKVQVTQAWQKSYSAGLYSVGRAIKCEVVVRSIDGMEQALFGALRMRPTLLAYDDANSFGPHSCNMVRDIVTETPSVQVIFTTPELFEKMRGKAWNEVDQMVSRGVIVEAPPIQPVDLVPFVTPLGLNGDTAAACEALAVAANHYGAFRLVKRVLEAVPAERVTLKSFQRGIAIAEAFYNQFRGGAR